LLESLNRGTFHVPRFWVLHSDITRALLGGVFGIRVSYFYMDVGGQLEMGSRSA
jgi:hypothetical protein